MDSLQKLHGRQVEVIYRGIRYEGKLVDAGTAEITLDTASGRITLPMGEITAVSPGRRGSHADG